MIQLQVGLTGEAIATGLGDFNSAMIQLQANILSHVRNTGREFQFLNDTITSRGNLLLICAKHLNFNSSMIQLQVAGTLVGVVVRVTDFNSSMIQLQVRDNDLKQYHSIFQFLNDTITRCLS